MIPNPLTQLSVAMVANNIGRTETGIVAENSTGVLHRAVTNHKFNQIFLKRMNNSNTEQIFTQNSSCIFAIKEYVAESLGCSKQYMPQKFMEMSSKFHFGQEFIKKLSPDQLLLHNTEGVVVR